MTELKKRATRGFTLLELMTVIAIIAVLMGATTAAFFGMGRGARMRGAINTLRSSVGLIRQEAILKGQVLELRFFESGGLYGYYGTNVVDHYGVGEVGYFPRGVRIVQVNTVIEFYPSGSAGNTGRVPLTLRETDDVASPASATLTVYPLTGLMKVDY